MKILTVRAAAFVAAFVLFSLSAFAALPQFTPTSAGVAAIKSDGTLWTWGQHYVSGLGDTSLIARPSPVQVGTQLWTSVSASNNYVLAVRADGTLWAWGHGFEGLYGDLATYRAVPTQIGAASDWAQVDGGEFHAVGVRSDGTLWGWGSDFNGELGLFSPTPILAPVQIAPGVNWTKAMAGFGFTLALRSDGSLAQLGFGLFTFGEVDGEPPFLLNVPDTDWADISAGTDHVVARKLDGSLWSWGAGYRGQIESTDPQPAVPLPLGAGQTWARFAACDDATLALRADGTLWAIGSGFGPGVGGFQTFLQVGAESDWGDIGCNRDFGLALKIDGTLASFGRSTFSALGDGTHFWQLEPAQIDAATTWQALSPSFFIADGNAAVHSDGSLWAWGPFSGGAPRLATVSDPWDPVTILPVAWKQFARTGSLESLLLTTDGTLYSVFPSGAPSPTFFGLELIGGAAEWDSIAAGERHTLGIKKDGTLWAWGVGDHGQLGNGYADPSLSGLVQVGTDTDWKSASAGGGHSAAIRTDATLWVWGDNSKGQLGLGYAGGDVYYPQQVDDRRWKAVSAGADHTLALLENGGLLATGFNAFGEVGDGTTTQRNEFVQIATEAYAEISAGPQLSFAIRTDGKLAAWGASENMGALGDGSFRNRSRPVQIGNGTWRKVAAQAGGAVAVAADGRLWAWGRNVFSMRPLPRFNLVPVASSWNAYAPSASLTWPTLAENFVLEFATNGPAVSEVLTLRAGPGAVNLGPITAPAPFEVAHGCPATLPANAACDITVTFRPTQFRSYTGMLTIGSNATVGSTPLPLSGISVADLPDPIPDAFAFASRTDVLPGSMQISDPVTPTGYNTPALVQLTNGQFCLSSTASCACDARPFATSTVGVIRPGQSLCVRHLSSSLPVASTVTTVSVGFIPSGNGMPPPIVVGSTIATFTTTTRRATSAVTLASDPNPSMLNESVTFTATVAGAFGTPGGSVTFKEGGAALGTSPVTGGTATLDVANLAVGPHIITAEFGGSTTYLPSTSAPLVHAVTSGDSPALGTVLDLNNDGNEDVLVPTAGSATLYLMDGATVIGTLEVSGPAAEWNLTHVADFNGDGKSDLVWQAAAGEIELWIMDGLTPVTQQRLAGLPPGAVVEQIGDFNGDGKSDLVFVGTDGQVDAWLMDGVAPTSSATLAATTAGLTLTQVGDLDADGKSDIIWTTDAGAILMWLMDGLAPHGTSELVPPTLGLATLAMSDGGSKKTEPVWRVVALGDFDGNGRKDLAVGNKEGRTVVLLMSGLQVTGSVEIAPVKSKVERVHAVDLSGDGMDDVVIEFHDGTVQARTLEGTLITGTAVLPQDGKKMSILRTGDLDGDGKGDLIWRGKGDRSLEVWIMDGLSIRSRQVLRSGR